MGDMKNVSKAPWKAIASTGELTYAPIGDWIIKDSSGLYIATVIQDGPPLAAPNAHLMAASPELYEALKAITDCYGVGYKDPAKFVEHVHEFVLEGRAALAKARGEYL